MNEKGDRPFAENMLSAEELLRNRGIRYDAWDEWECSTRVLPKTGQKQFEPNGSTLQNMQLEKGIKNRADLLSIERVERSSQLAMAEWLPIQKKAKVTKKTGQDWVNFGTEINSTLYLVPEEALVLLEMNCLELTWNGVPLSIQQAYETLIDGRECTLEEYRVYSHLVRNGYRIQRFSYGSETGSVRTDEPLTPKRKVIIDPENGLRMTDGQTQQLCSEPVVKPPVAESTPDNQKCTVTDALIRKEVQLVLEGIKTSVENLLASDSRPVRENNGENVLQPDARKPDCEVRVKDSAISEKTNGERKSRNSKIEIISDERLIGGIKILKEPIENAVNSTPAKHSGSRIQRNVKLLPKRNDKPTLNADIPGSDHGERTSDKRKATAWCPIPSKKPRNEVIELSDDEVQEVPRALTRMEMLNLIPNIASQPVIVEIISRGYIPHNINPRQTTYCYKREEISKVQATDRQLRSNAKRDNDNSRNVSSPPHSNIPGNIESTHRNMVVSYQTIYANYNTPYSYNNASNRFPIGPRFSVNHTAYWQNRPTFVQQNIYQNTLNFVTFGSSDTAIQRNLSIQMNTFFMPHIGNPTIRNTFVRNQYRQNYYQNVPLHHRYPQHRMSLDKNMFSPTQSSPRAFCPPSQGLRPRYSSRSSPNDSNSPRNFKQLEAPNRSIFVKYPGMNSWAELKKKWREEKTITIDDEDSNRDDSVDNSEVQVVDEFINPLVGPKNANSLADVFEKLRIIKSAPEKTVRRKKGRYRISYNVYSSASHYRKANPGSPMYRIVVVRKDTSQFLEPIELARLQQDAKGASIMLAYVSMTISFIQPAIVSLPNLN